MKVDKQNQLQIELETNITGYNGVSNLKEDK